MSQHLNAATPRQTGWRHYFNRKMLICVMLGFTSGLPLFMLYNLMSAWLKAEQVDLKSIGLFALVGFPYTWKFIWSPLMDRFHFPLLGRRRGWMFITQLALLAVIGSMGFYSPATELPMIVFLAGLAAFLSASQDIVIDAFRVESLPENEQAAGMAAYVAAYRIGMLVSGAGMIGLAAWLETKGLGKEVIWPIAYTVRLEIW